MDDLKAIKERFVKHPFTTGLGLVGGIATAIAAGGGKAAVIAGVCVAVLGALFKDPQIPGGGSPA